MDCTCAPPVHAHKLVSSYRCLAPCIHVLPPPQISHRCSPLAMPYPSHDTCVVGPQVLRRRLLRDDQPRPAGFCGVLNAVLTACYDLVILSTWRGTWLSPNDPGLAMGRARMGQMCHSLTPRAPG